MPSNQTTETNFAQLFRNRSAKFAGKLSRHERSLGIEHAERRAQHLNGVLGHVVAVLPVHNDIAVVAGKWSEPGQTEI